MTGKYIVFAYDGLSRNSIPGGGMNDMVLPQTDTLNQAIIVAENRDTSYVDIARADEAGLHWLLSLWYGHYVRLCNDPDVMSYPTMDELESEVWQ